MKSSKYGIMDWDEKEDDTREAETTVRFDFDSDEAKGGIVMRENVFSRQIVEEKTEGKIERSAMKYSSESFYAFASQEDFELFRHFASFAEPGWYKDSVFTVFDDDNCTFKVDDSAFVKMFDYQSKSILLYKGVNIAKEGQFFDESARAVHRLASEKAGTQISRKQKSTTGNYSIVECLRYLSRGVSMCQQVAQNVSPSLELNSPKK